MSNYGGFFDDNGNFIVCEEYDYIDVTRVKDYMCIDDNKDVFIELHLKEDRDTCSSFYELIWSGLVKDIPEKYQEFEVLLDGWLIGKCCYCLEIIK